jgi:hypothetical protein
LEDVAVKSHKWLIIAIVLSLIFAFFTPVSFYDSVGYFLSLVEGVVIGLFVFMYVLQIPTFNDLFFLSTEEYPGLYNPLVIVIPIGTVILSSFIFLYSTSYWLDSLLKEKGVSAIATITQGFQVNSQSIRSNVKSRYTLTLNFPLQNGKPFTVSTNVSSDIYNSVSYGQRVEVRYLPDDPSIFRIIAGDENVQKFKGISNRNLNFNDLEMIIKLHKKDSIIKYLSQISTIWDVYKGMEGATVFVNESKREVIVKNADGNIKYKGPDLTTIDFFLRDIKILETREETIKDDPKYNTKNIKTFVADHYIIEHISGTNKQDSSIEFFLIVRRRL